MTDEQLCKAYRDSVDIKIEKLEVKLESTKTLNELQVRANDKALELAREILDKKMIAENNIREEMRERTARFIQRAEYDGKHESLILKIDNLAEKTNTLSGKMMLIIIGIPIFVSLVISIVSMFIFHMATK